ncbi:MAG: hypothetical protein GX359_00040 [Clostridiales bacterium]|nr:hypothetical protein [Clostridiales bacterium]
MIRTRKISTTFSIILALIMITVHIPKIASGDIKQITEAEDKLENISNEEKAVLEELFFISQHIDEMEIEEEQISMDMERIQAEIGDIENTIVEKQKEYDEQLVLLERFLVLYQRSGPATYIEFLLKAENLTEFLKSMNIIKDISKNVGELLASLEEYKELLEQEKARLDEKLLSLEAKKTELQINLEKQRALRQEQEDYLASLKVDKAFYEEQLSNLEQLWDANKMLFSEIVDEITRIVGEGYFTMEDLNIMFSFTGIKGHISDDTFNQVLNRHSDLTETIFTFQPGKIIIEIPENHMIIGGSFILAGESTIEFIPEEGRFYDMELEQSSLDELFRNSPLTIDFKAIAGEMVIFNFAVENVESQEGSLAFEIKLQF